MHAEVCVFEMALGEHETLTDDTLDPEDADPTETAVVPNFVVSCAEVPVIVALPAAAGVNAPPAEMVPFVAVQVTD